MPNDYRRVMENMAEMEKRAKLLSQRQGVGLSDNRKIDGGQT